MHKQATLPVILGFVIFFTVLFHDKALGINLLIFESGFIAYLLFSGQLDHKTRKLRLLITAQLVTCIATILVHTAYGYIIHFFVSMVFVGVLTYPSVKSLLNSLLIAISSVFSSQHAFILQAKQIRIGEKRPATILWESRLFAIPSLIILLFITIYNFSNPKFNAITADFTSGIIDFLRILLRDYDLTILVTMFLGLLTANFILIRNPETGIIANDIRSNDALENPVGKPDYNRDPMPVRNEMKSAIFLLVTLNAVLLVVNIIDINWVWFNFKWEGQYLKQFVHEGTSLLIISILLSIAIVLYFFRGLINFEENKLLKYLSYAWLTQNAILTVSVAIRNLYYIENFNLAYKRIGVIIFLILTLYGLFSVLLKVNRKYSAFYLFRTNFNALLIVLMVSSLINWDALIAKYNFNHSETAFVHFNFLAGLSAKTLPYLDKPLAELQKINTAQKKTYPQESNYMTPEAYYKMIQRRKGWFRKSWEKKGWLSWNLPEQLAYNKLFSMKSR